MSTATLKIENGCEPIPGYTVIKKLGVGGYGEVWSAEAPGGIEKAVKFVFGSHDSERGTRELRSLNRMKGVNHPFLISVERFEVVKGQLIIVTELANGSLEEIFDKHRERGSCGIPKTELIKYLHDAADGLDYLHEQFQLQHLDVKPGNLLMVGGHVKVGDFGLLKDLGDIECSMVGGLTPIYAAPEVFDGRPHFNSDQYSLAVMYQELLTGHRPFGGRTIAQLATQHVHSAPNLDALPPADRPVIARALEKDPDRRFANCTELIARLSRSNEKPVNIPAQVDAASGSTETVSRTGDFSPNGPSVQVENLPKVDSQILAATGTKQALVIGLGGVGREVMQHLCQEQSLSCDPDCDLRGLLIDTDDASIYGFREFEIENNLICNVERACFPLKSPHDYRGDSAERLTSISRRWVYNIPKSRKTEGMRPLGRLALIDHASHVKRLLEQAITSLSNEGQSPARIYVVSSTSGGTGSGMFLDVAFILRQLLDDLGYPESTIRPLLLAAVPKQGGKDDTLAVASSHAALSELHYFLAPNKSYPEDRVNSIGPVPSGRNPLANTYVVTSSDRHEGVKQIADYLLADAFMSPTIIDAARKNANADVSNRSQPTLRSFGISTLQVRPLVDLNGIKHKSIDLLIRRWIGNPKVKTGDIQQKGQALLDEIGICPRAWADAQLLDLLGQEIKAWRSETIRSISAQIANCGPDDLAAKEAVILARAKIQPLLAKTAKTEDMSQKLDQSAEQSIAKLKEVICRNLRSGKLNLFNAVELLKYIGKKCFVIAQENEKAIANMKQEAEKSLHGFTNNLSPSVPGEVDVDSVVDSTIMLMRAVLQKPNGMVFEEIGDQVKSIEKKLLANATNNAALHKLLHRELPSAETGPNEAQEKIVPLVVTRLHENFSPRLLFGSIESDLIAENESPEDQLSQMEAAAIETAEAALNDTSGNGIVSLSELDSQIATALKTAHPSLLAYGGKQRVLLLGSDEAQLKSLKATVEQVAGFEISVAKADCKQPILVHEASEIPVESILGSMIGALGADQSIAGRLMARCDIQWSEPLDRPSTTYSKPFKQ